MKVFLAYAGGQKESYFYFRRASCIRCRCEYRLSVGNNIDCGKELLQRAGIEFKDDEYITFEITEEELALLILIGR